MNHFIYTEKAINTENNLIKDLISKAGITVSWDFNAALGDTIMEKYESLYVKLVKTSNLINKATKGW